jgi:RecA-family ATPase
MEDKELNNVVPQVTEDLPAEENPVEGIIEEVEKAKRAPKHTGVLSIKSANDWIEDAAKRPNPKLYFHGLIVQYENTVLFASSNVGKSILAVQIGEDIARTEKIYYIDLELADKQFQLRYSDTETGAIHVFPPGFMRAEVDPELIGGVDLEQEILDSIEEAAKQGAKFVIVDNLTFICHDAEKSAQASEFMMKLIRLKKKFGLTTIVIAHTPKRRGYEPITQDDLAGSSKLISFFDAGIALARSARDNNLRYLKQVKVRTGEFLYDSDNVIVYDLVKEDGFLHFEVHGYAKEEEHLNHGNPADDLDEILDILRLQRDGKSLREIAKVLDISLGKVQRRLEKAKAQNITLDNFPDEGVSDVSNVSEDEDPIQPIHDTRKRRTKKRKED